jgi:hypothetical protein
MNIVTALATKYKVVSLTVTDLQVGDIVKYKNKHDKAEFRFFTVAYKEPNGDFYYYCSDEKGGLDKKCHARPFHSNMFNADEQKTFKKVGKKEFKVNKIKEFEIVKTGLSAIDKGMAQLGGLWELFQKYATKSLKKKFDEMEDVNYHAENNKMIEDFSKWLAKGKEPKDFEKEYKFPELPTF